MTAEKRGVALNSVTAALLITALRQTSEERLERYREVVGPIESLEALVPAMADLWQEDNAAGHVKIVAQLVAGSVNRPELSKHLVELMEPWVALAEETFERVLPRGLPVADIAFEVNRSAQNIGARRLHTILEKVVEEVSYEGPDLPDKRVVVDGRFVREKLGPIVKGEDLSKFIL